MGKSQAVSNICSTVREYRCIMLQNMALRADWEVLWANEFRQIALEESRCSSWGTAMYPWRKPLYPLEWRDCASLPFGGFCRRLYSGVGTGVGIGRSLSRWAASDGDLTATRRKNEVSS